MATVAIVTKPPAMFNGSMENFRSNESITDNDQPSLMQGKPTLLQLATLYRQQHPDKVAERKRKQIKHLNESYGIFERDSFLENYYVEQEKKRLEELEELELEKHMPPQLDVTLEFNLPDEVKKGFIKSHRTYKKVEGDGLFIFYRDESKIETSEEHENNFREETRGDEPELLIRVYSGKHLNNKLAERDHEPIYKSTLECELFAKGTTGGSTTKHKTKPVYVTSRGSAFWEYVFVIKGYTREQLHQSHVILTVNGKFRYKDEEEQDSFNSNKSLNLHHLSSRHLSYPGCHRVEIGQSVLGNYKTKHTIWKRNHSSRGASNVESKAWEKALKNPGKTIPVDLILHEKEESILKKLRPIFDPVNPNFEQHKMHQSEDSVEIHHPKGDKDKSILQMDLHHNHKKQKEEIPSISELVRPSVNIQRSDSIGDADDLQDEQTKKSKVHFNLPLQQKKKTDDQRKLSIASRSSIDSVRSESGSINEEAGTSGKNSSLSFGFRHRNKKDKEESANTSRLISTIHLSKSSALEEDTFVIASAVNPEKERKRV